MSTFMKVEVNERDERLAGFTGLLLRLIVPALMPQSEQNLAPPSPFYTSLLFWAHLLPRLGSTGSSSQVRPCPGSPGSLLGMWVSGLRLLNLDLGG